MVCGVCLWLQEGETAGAQGAVILCVLTDNENFMHFRKKTVISKTALLEIQSFGM